MGQGELHGNCWLKLLESGKRRENLESQATAWHFLGTGKYFPCKKRKAKNVSADETSHQPGAGKLMHFPPDCYSLPRAGRGGILSCGKEGFRRLKSEWKTDFCLNMRNVASFPAAAECLCKTSGQKLRRRSSHVADDVSQGSFGFWAEVQCRWVDELD